MHDVHCLCAPEPYRQFGRSPQAPEAVSHDHLDGKRLTQLGEQRNRWSTPPTNLARTPRHHNDSAG